MKQTDWTASLCIGVYVCLFVCAIYFLSFFPGGGGVVERISFDPSTPFYLIDPTNLNCRRA